MTEAVGIMVAGSWPIAAVCKRCGQPAICCLEWMNANEVDGPFCIDQRTCKTRRVAAPEREGA